MAGRFVKLSEKLDASSPEQQTIARMRPYLPKPLGEGGLCIAEHAASGGHH